MVEHATPGMADASLKTSVKTGGSVVGKTLKILKSVPEVVHGGRLVLAGQAALIPLAVAGDVNRMPLLQLLDLLLDRVPARACGVKIHIFNIFKSRIQVISCLAQVKSKI